jgi:hypothetical protein
MAGRYKASPEEDMLLNIETFFVQSWNHKEYRDAIQQDEFYDSVKHVLDTSLSSDDNLSREDLICSKEYFGGNSARLMFLYPVKKIVEQVNSAVDSAEDCIRLFEGYVGDMSDRAVNRILSSSLSPDDDSTRKVSIVSRYAAVKLAMQAGPELIRRLAEVTRRERNPSMDGWMLEMWFFASLQHGGVKVVNFNGYDVVDTWDAFVLTPLDVTTSFPSIPLDSGVWLKPTKWNQGGYDAVYVEKSKSLVRFVQVTGADSHSFKIEYFYGFLFALQNSGEAIEVKCLEIFFVVDWKKRDDFKLSDPSGQGLLTPFGWLPGKEKESVKIVYLRGWTTD